jgi:glutaredoxin
MDEHITMYIKSECPFCIKAQHELLKQKVNHTTYIMDNKLDELKSVKEKWDQPTVPIVLCGPALAGGAPTLLIGGYTELKTYFSDKPRGAKD